MNYRNLFRNAVFLLALAVSINRCDKKSVVMNNGEDEPQIVHDEAGKSDDGHLFYDIMTVRHIKSVSLINNEIRMYYNDNPNYLLYRQF